MRTEAHVRAIALWFFGWAAVGLVSLLILFMIASLMNRLGVLSPGRLMYFGFLYLILIVLGVFLGRFHPAARIGGAVFSGLVALSFFLMIGAAIDSMTSKNQGVTFGLSVMFSIPGLYFSAIAYTLLRPQAARLFTPEYAQRVEDSPEVRPNTFASPFFYLPAGALILGVISLIVSIW